MTDRRTTLSAMAPRLAVLTLVACMGLGLGSAFAATQYLGDGAVPNGVTGGWDLPKQGTCPTDTNQTTRPDCLALRLNVIQANCTSGNNQSWTTSGVCNDLVNTDQTSCEAQVDRKWNSATSTCAVVLKNDDRNNIECALHGATWVTTGTCVGSWVMPARNDAAYGAGLLTGNGPGDQCLRCHNATTQYNGPRVRDVEDTLYMGHRNMARKVVAGQGWGGPPMECDNPLYLTEDACEANGGHWYPIDLYPSTDSGLVFDWVNGTINVGGIDRDLYWIYGDWLGPLPRAVYSADPVAGTPLKPGASYSCARCHTTGWTSDATLQANKEPEESFGGITWDGVSDAVTGQVNLASGVNGDTNKMASWDLFGIQCTRCHSSAIDDTTGTGTPPQYSAPAGMSTHHNNLTVPDISSGTCTDVRFTRDTECLAAGGQWLTACDVNPTTAVCTQAITTSAACVAPGAWVAAPGWCSNAFYSDQTNCTANGFAWQDGWCTRPDKDVNTCTGGSGTSALTWRRNGSQASCQVGAGTWSFSKCSVEGVCNIDNTITSKAACDLAGGQFAYATDIIRCVDIEEAVPSSGAEWTGNNTNRGQIITSLCMNCHRQETQGQPYANTGSGVGSGSTSNPGTYVKVGQYHSTITFPSHPHGNMFLNSPHGQFTGTFDQIATAKFGTGYDSYFQFDGEAANTGNGCTGCHNPHRSTVAAVGGEEAFEPCQKCHTGPYAVDLNAINHLKGAGTPFDTELFGEGEAEPCITCHMPGGQHMFRINPDKNYSTFPSSVFSSSAVTNANTAAEGSFTNAVWVDVDAACGQCHGGGTAKASTTLTVANSTDTTLGKTLTVASTTGFAVGQRITLAGAGSYSYDDQGSVSQGDFESYVTAVNSATTLTVVGAAPFSVAPGASLKQNPVEHGAPYYTKAQLAAVAKGMHGSSGTVYPVTFSITPSGSGLTVTVDATVNCGSDPCPALTYDWEWGDGSANGSADPDSHTYATAGAKTIKLTVNLMGKVAGSATRSITLTAIDQPPTAAATCTWDANLWKMSVLDASTDDNAVTQVVVDFGDGSSKTIAPAGSSINRTYTKPGTYTVTDRAIDSKLQSAVYTCPTQATPALFSISGTVKNKTGATNLSTATVQLYNGANIVKSTLTAANGTFTLGNLKPASYTLKVSKSGYTFANPAATIQVGPSSAGNTINATNK